MPTKTVAVEITGDSTSAVRAVERVATASQKSATQATAHFDKATSKIGGLFKGLDNQLGAFGIPFTGALTAIGNKMEDTSTKGKSAFGGLAAFAQGSFLGVAAAAGVIAVIGIKAAQEQEVATARLQQAVKNAGLAWKDYLPVIDRAEKHAINMGFADEDLDSGLTKLIGTTKDVKKSVDLMRLAEDIARGRHISLSAATDLLAKVTTGHVALLGRFGIATKDATGKTISQEDAVRKLTDLYGGNAQRFTGTFQGKLEVLKAKLGEVAEKIGFALIPIIKDLADWLSKAIDWVEKNKESFKRAWEDIQAVADAVWPHIKEVLQGFKDFFLGVVNLIDDLIHGRWTEIFGDIVDIVKGSFEATFGWAIPFIKDAWHEIEGFFGHAADVIRPILAPIEVAVRAVGDALQWIWDHAADAWAAFSSGIDTMWGVVKPILEPLLDMIGLIISGVKTITGMGQGSGDFGPGPVGNAIASAQAAGIFSIPLVDQYGNYVGPPLHFAEGGQVPGYMGQPQLAVVHGGERVLTPEQQGGGIVIQNLNITDPYTDPFTYQTELAQAIRTAMWMAGV